MTLTLAKKMVNPGGAVYYSPEYRTMIESHLSWLKTLSSTYMAAISSDDAYKFEGDLTGLLKKYNVPLEHHYVVMRMNGLNDVTEYRSTMNRLLIPHYQVLENLRQVFASTYTPMA